MLRVSVSWPGESPTDRLQVLSNQLEGALHTQKGSHLQQRRSDAFSKRCVAILEHTDSSDSGLLE